SGSWRRVSVNRRAGMATAPSSSISASTYSMIEISRSVAVRRNWPSLLSNKIVSNIGRVALFGTAPDTAESALTNALLDKLNLIKGIFLVFISLQKDHKLSTIY